jgi:hypothetical protein
MANLRIHSSHLAFLLLKLLEITYFFRGANFDIKKKIYDGFFQFNIFVMIIIVIERLLVLGSRGGGDLDFFFHWII